MNELLIFIAKQHEKFLSQRAKAIAEGSEKVRYLEGHTAMCKLIERFCFEKGITSPGYAYWKKYNKDPQYSRRIGHIEAKERGYD